MSLQHFLNAYIGNLNFIIECLFVGILVSVSLYLLRAIKVGSEDERTHLEKIEESLKKVVSQASFNKTSKLEDIEDDEEEESDSSQKGPSPKTASGSASQTGSPGAVSAESERVIAELNGKVQSLQQALENAKASGGQTTDTKPLEAKIKELETKLTDYEIISDDIANLTLYKQENARLKDEIARMKGGQGVPEPANGTQTAPKVTEEVVMRIGEEPDRAVAEPKPQKEIAPVAQAPTTSMVEPVRAPSPSSSPSSSVDPILEASVLAALADPPESPGASDDIMAEFADVAASPAPEAAAEPAVQATIQNQPTAQSDPSAPVANAPATGPEAGQPGSALKVEVDAEKMVSEVAQFVPSQAPQVPKTAAEESSQLISEFENFMKSS